MKPIPPFAAIFALIACPLAGAPQTDGHLPAVGVDTAGTFFLRNKTYSGEGWRFPAWRDAIAELGAEFLMDHYFEVATGGTLRENEAATRARIKALGDYLGQSGLDYVFNLETANWTPRKDYIPGQNMFEPHPGSHYYQVPEPVLEALAKMPGMKAVCFDEIEHVQISSGLKSRPSEYPALADTRRMTLPEANAALVARLMQIREYYKKHGVAPVAENVWPVMQHLFARAGWTVSPKIMKESWTPVPVAMALGAGIEYENAGADVWMNPDLWFCGHYPGHSVDETRSALVFSHWLGVSRVYLENMDYVNARGGAHQPDAAKNFDYTKIIQGRHHPDAAGSPASLVRFANDREFSLTAYGRAFRDYARDYRPANPVPYTWRDARCRVAIVRFEDSCWGQRDSTFGDTLLGSEIEKSTPETEAWFGIWHLLSHGVIPKKGLSFHIRAVKYKEAPRFFVPAPPTLVFDHRIGDEHPDFDFRGAEMIFLTGIGLSKATLELVQRRVNEGAVAATLHHLAPDELKRRFAAAGQEELEVADGAGRWIVCRDFLGAKVRAALAPLLGPPDELHYQFGGHRLIIKNIDNDRIEVWLDGQRRHTPPATPSKR
ncbi:MAG: hypothetical protein LBI02_10705, partial [Opitutaceae bacterium]|nr:hypothetical protein [Opitutaceae bacterium]